MTICCLDKMRRFWAALSLRKLPHRVKVKLRPRLVSSSLSQSLSVTSTEQLKPPGPDQRHAVDSAFLENLLVRYLITGLNSSVAENGPQQNDYLFLFE